MQINFIFRWSILLLALFGIQSCTNSEDASYRLGHVVQIDPGPGELKSVSKENTLVLFTPEVKQVPTGIHWGTMALVRGDTVSRFSSCPDTIPADGWLICGWGKGSDWIIRNIFPGVPISFDRDSVYVDASPKSRLKQINFLLNEPYGTPTISYHDEAERMTRVFQQNGQTAALDSAYSLARDYQFSGGLPYFGIHGAYLDLGDMDSVALRQAVIEMVGIGIQVIFPKVIYDGYAIYPDAHPGLRQNPVFAGWDPLRFLMKLSLQYPISFVPRLEVYSIGGNGSPLVSEKMTWLATSRVGQVGVDLDRFFCPSEQLVDEFWIAVYRRLESEYGVTAILLEDLHYPESDGWQQDYCYCDRCTGNFKKEFGVDPTAITPSDTLMWANWDTYRTQQVNRMIRHIHEAFPSWRIGVDVLPDEKYARLNLKQDWAYWSERNWIQVVFTENRSCDLDEIRTQSGKLKSFSLAGTMVMPVLETSPHDDALNLIKQIDIISSARLDGMVLKSWNDAAPELKHALKVGPFRYY
ncbi:MAG: hypothetical protein KDC59_09705 [Saprospiraceae bacterium]|nr:hypothetical protein [Saprospiraceae bacterium]HPG08632.1 hypothetical protein [Saprospiraceae bacterium]